MPGYRHVINEFIWQLVDEVPNIPRTHRFLNFWKNNIDAVVKDVQISKSEIGDYKTAKAVYDI